jgi:hypothetical protein
LLTPVEVTDVQRAEPPVGDAIDVVVAWGQRAGSVAPCKRNRYLADPDGDAKPERAIAWPRSVLRLPGQVTVPPNAYHALLTETSRNTKSSRQRGESGSPIIITPASPACVKRSRQDPRR